MAQGVPLRERIAAVYPYREQVVKGGGRVTYEEWAKKAQEMEKHAATYAEEHEDDWREDRYGPRDFWLVPPQTDPEHMPMATGAPSPTPAASPSPLDLGMMEPTAPEPTPGRCARCWGAGTDAERGSGGNVDKRHCGSYRERAHRTGVSVRP